MTRQDFLFLLLLALSAGVVFSNGLTGDFLYDDKHYITNNPQVTGEASIFGESMPPEKPHAALYRPVFVITLRINHAMAGFKPSVFHGTNLLLHVLCVWALYFLIRRIAGDRAGAFLSALLFAVHPSHVEAVTWLVGRAELLACLFCLLAAWAHLKASERAGWRLAEALFFALALLSKENALVFPAALWLLEHLCVPKEKRAWLKDTVRDYGIYVLLIAGILITRYVVMGRFSPAIETAPFKDAGLLERGEAALACLAEYLRLYLFPYPLKIFYHISEIRDLTLIRGIFLLLFAGLVMAACKRRSPLAGWLLWIPATLLTVLNLVPIGAVFAERFFYLPSAGACAAMGLAFTGLIRWEHQKRGSHHAIWIPCLLILCFSILTFARNPVFNTTQALWKDAVRKGGDFAYPHYNLGESYFEKDIYEYQSPEIWGAVAEFQESLRLNPDHPYAFAAHYRLGEYYLFKRAAPRLAQGADHLEKAVRLGPWVPEKWKPALLLASFPLLFGEPGMVHVDPSKAWNYLGLAEQLGAPADKIQEVRNQLKPLLDSRG